MHVLVLGRPASAGIHVHGEGRNCNLVPRDGTCKAGQGREVGRWCDPCRRCPALPITHSTHMPRMMTTMNIRCPRPQASLSVGGVPVTLLDTAGEAAFRRSGVGGAATAAPGAWQRAACRCPPPPRPSRCTHRAGRPAAWRGHGAASQLLDACMWRGSLGTGGDDDVMMLTGPCGPPPSPLCPCVACLPGGLQASASQSTWWSASG